MADDVSVRFYFRAAAHARFAFFVLGLILGALMTLTVSGYDSEYDKIMRFCMTTHSKQSLPRICSTSHSLTLVRARARVCGMSRSRIRQQVQPMHLL